MDNEHMAVLAFELISLVLLSILGLVSRKIISSFKEETRRLEDDLSKRSCEDEDR